MAFAHSSEDDGRLVLDAFRYYGVMKGEPLLAQNITAYAWNHNRSTREVKAGLIYANNNCWVAKLADGSLALTDVGFGEIRKKA